MDIQSIKSYLECSDSENAKQLAEQKVQEVLLHVIKKKDSNILNSNDILNLVGNIQLLFRVTTEQVKRLSAIKMDKSKEALLEALDTAESLYEEYCLS